MQSPAKQNSSDAGFLFIGYGKAYVAEAIEAAQSLRRVHPGCQICLVTDAEQESLPDKLFNYIRKFSVKKEMGDTYADGDRSAYYVKISALLETPFEKTIYLDTDAHVVGRISHLHELLEQFDLLVCPSPHIIHFQFESDTPPFSSIPDCFGTFNTGMLAYRLTDPVKKFITEWDGNHRHFSRPFTTNDQPAFRYTLFHSELRFLVVSDRFNCFAWKSILIPSGNPVSVVHTRNPWMRRWVPTIWKRGAPVAVGNIALRATFLWYLARLLFWWDRYKSRFVRGRKP